MSENQPSISRKILFVDDEKLLLEGIKRQLRRDFDITVAEGGAAALAIISSAGPFAMVISDYNMPSMDGIEFLNHVYQLHPDSVLVMLTGRAELDIAVNALHNAHISRFLNKPCPKEILLDTLNDGLEQYRLRMIEKLLQSEIQQANQQLHKMNNHLEELVDEKTRALQFQYCYVADLAQLSHSQTIVDTLIDAVIRLTGIADISLWLSPDINGQFACFYPNNEKQPAFAFDSCPSGVISETIRTKKYWLCGPENQQANQFDQSLFMGKPYLSKPLIGKHGVIGLLNLAGEDIQLEQDSQDALTSMLDVTATALQSFWNREAFEDAQDAIITALAKLSEYRDPETGAHLLRLKKYSALICQYLAETEQFRDVITSEFTMDVIRSSPLHDIGKVGTPDVILKKPGKLTDEEFEIMKMHSNMGGDTLRAVYEEYPSQGFIKCGMDIAYFHHEKWDGSGYPNGLKGDEIPLAAQILGLVDVYDALTTRRVYKPPFPREQANAIIAEGNGHHFAPALVEAFLNHEAEFHAIAQQFADTE